MDKISVAVLLIVIPITSAKQCDGSESKNRDGVSACYKDDPRGETEAIAKAHQILSQALKQFLNVREDTLAFYLNEMIRRKEAFVDEYGNVIGSYRKVFRFILTQHNEVLRKNYAVGQFDKDKLDMCSVARYLSHKTTKGQDRNTLMKRMSDALDYRCHPCTPYKPRLHGPTQTFDSSGIPPEGLSIESSLRLCNRSDMVTTTVRPPPAVDMTSAACEITNQPHQLSADDDQGGSCNENGTICVTNGGPWGHWYSPEYCPSGTLAIGFQVKIQKPMGAGGPQAALDDDTALNGIVLFCASLSSPHKIVANIKSYEHKSLFYLNIMSL